MALPVSAISQACKSVRDFVSDGLESNGEKLHVLIGTPAEAAPGTSDSDHRVNLFFHRISPAGFGSHTGPGDPWLVRLHCLITAFATTANNISAGENDLRLIGEVVRLFHETPVLAPIVVNGETVRLQVVFQPLSLDEINHLWSTQGDVAYRPSVLYEMALAPVVPSERTVDAGRVAAVGHEVRATMDARQAPFGGIVEIPPVLASKIDIKCGDWAPRMCFLRDGVCEQSLVFEVGSNALNDFQPTVWIAGKTDETVELRWEIWDRTEGWRAGPKEVEEPNPFSERIDPEKPPSEDDLVKLPTVTLPFDDHAGQAVLYASRTYRLAGDSRDRVVRSNPLLITLFEGEHA